MVVRDVDLNLPRLDRVAADKRLDPFVLVDLQQVVLGHLLNLSLERLGLALKHRAQISLLEQQLVACHRLQATQEGDG